MAVVVPKTIVIAPIQNKRPLSVIAGVDKAHNSVGIFTSSDGDESLSDMAPRKRRRLTHLTPEERMMRRKLKNRVAAQTARDRKKMRMQELEEAVAALEEENRRLQEENNALKQQTGNLSQENTVLREKLGLEGARSEICDPPESAALNPPQQQEKDHILSLAASQFLVYIVLTVMSLSLLDCCSKLLKIHHQRQMTLFREKALTTVIPVEQINHPSQWWGPQQQSWNPSKN